MDYVAFFDELEKISSVNGRDLFWDSLDPAFIEMLKEAGFGKRIELAGGGLKGFGRALSQVTGNAAASAKRSVTAPFRRMARGAPSRSAGLQSATTAPRAMTGSRSLDRYVEGTGGVGTGGAAGTLRAAGPVAPTQALPAGARQQMSRMTEQGLQANVPVARGTGYGTTRGTRKSFARDKVQTNRGTRDIGTHTDADMYDLKTMKSRAGAREQYDQFLGRSGRTSKGVEGLEGRIDTIPGHSRDITRTPANVPPQGTQTATAGNLAPASAGTVSVANPYGQATSAGTYSGQATNAGTYAGTPSARTRTNARLTPASSVNPLGPTMIGGQQYQSFMPKMGGVAKYLARLGGRNEVAGLGVLAAPSVDDMVARVRAHRAGAGHEKLDDYRLIKEKYHAPFEVAGLGMLAAPYIGKRLSTGSWGH